MLFGIGKLVEGRRPAPRWGPGRSGTELYRSASLPIAEDTLLVDLGMDVALSESVSLGVAYSGQFGDGSTD